MSTELRRLVAFTALAAFVALQWALLVEDTPAWRWLACVALSSAGGFALIALRGRSTLVTWAGSAAVLAAMAGGGLLAIGFNVDLLVPGGWSDLVANLDRGLSGVSGIETPYRGSDPWTRLGILAAIPLAVPLAFLAAFWPGGESRLGRTAGLALLVLLYGVSVTWEAPSAELARGALLFCLIAAVLWLPQLRPGRAAGALAALVVAVAIAFPLASRVDASDPVIDYLDWSVFGSNERIAFDWNHSYGELDWPQEDSEVFVAATDRPLYWKTYVLDAFDGRGWTRGDDGFGSFAAQYYVAGATVEDVERHPEWVEEFEIELSGLRSRLAVTAGSPRDIEGIDIAQLSGDGTVTAENFEVPPETRYSVTTYAPDPSSRQLRRAEGLHPIESERYTTLRFLPGESGPGEASPEFAVIPPVGVEASPNERHRFEDIGVPLDPAVEGTPYERVLRLTRRITDGARTDFEAVRRLQLFLAANYRYDQTVPESQDPLVAFLFKDRTGYCQQFAGAMALMLRMSGIPARVVSGFAPGAPQAGGTYTVNDTDAHAWVEVRYPGIGWVTVDPTPGATPARTLVSSSDEESAAAASALRLGRRVPNRELGRGLPAARDESAESPSGGGSPLPALVVLALIAAASAIVIYRRRRLRSPEGAELQLRELLDALRATGREPPAGATLGTIGGRLSDSVGPSSARYASALRENRYGKRRRPRPGPAERRAFRWELARHSGAFGWWRVLRAMPPGGPRA